MSAVSPPLTDPLHARRCVRHVEREAAARCPDCGEFFCRECVVEHHGRLLCSACLQRITAAKERRRERWAAVTRSAANVAGMAALWLAFYWVGAVLVKMPPEFHDGSVWKKLVERTE